MQYPDCPGHSNKCKFCKSEHGYYRYLDEMKLVKKDGTPLIDECCRACEENHKHMKAHYNPIISAWTQTKMPKKGDEV